MSFHNPVYEENGDSANGSAVGYYEPNTFKRRYILSSTAEALYFDDLISAKSFIAWGVGGPAPIAFADIKNNQMIVLSSKNAYYRSFFTDDNLSIVTFNLDNNGFLSSCTVYNVNG